MCFSVMLMWSDGQERARQTAYYRKHASGGSFFQSAHTAFIWKLLIVNRLLKGELAFSREQKDTGAPSRAITAAPDATLPFPPSFADVVHPCSPRSISTPNVRRKKARRRKQKITASISKQTPPEMPCIF